MSNFTYKDTATAVTPQNQLPLPGFGSLPGAQDTGKQGASLPSLASASRRYIAQRRPRKPIMSPAQSGATGSPRPGPEATHTYRIACRVRRPRSGQFIWGEMR